jgi:hypothetical protein
MQQAILFIDKNYRMKKSNVISLLVLLFMLSLTKHLFSQNVGIGTTTPSSSARLDVTSTNSGFLPPRMTTAQRDAIANPAPGLMIINTSTQAIEFFTMYGWSKMKSSINKHQPFGKQINCYEKDR